MSMFSEPPSPGDKPAYQLTETTLEGPLGGHPTVIRAR
jgi:hypothetical protein